MHVGQIHGLSYELLSAVRLTDSAGTDCFVGFGDAGTDLDVAGGMSDGTGGGDDSVLGPAGCS